MVNETKIPPAPVYGRDQVVSIINSVLSKIQQPQAASREAISEELVMLKNAIEDLRHQLNSAATAGIGNAEIPTAKDELDAVVGATEQATTTIMDSCEKILAQMGDASPDLVQKTEAEIVRIYEACTFQDITGQRISKVVKTLKKIDEQVSSLLNALDSHIGQGGGQAEQVTGDAALLNGPALPENAMSQEDIDKLLASFDN